MFVMKRLHFIIPAVSILALAFASCSAEDNNVIKDVEALKIDSVSILNETMTIGSSQAITTFSQYQENCEGFYGYDYQANEKERVVKSFKFKNESPCGTRTLTGSSTINFAPRETGQYNFKFWQGKDSAGNDIWITKTIVVN